VVVKEFDMGKCPGKVRKDAHHEASVLNNLSHPNIIAYYDTYEDSVRVEFIVHRSFPNRAVYHPHSHRELS
jgi:hypothetical protein